MKNMLVKEHVRRQIHTISDSVDFREVLTQLIQKKTNGLIVVDNEGQPVGTVDSFLLIKHMVPEYLRENVQLARLASEDLLHKSVSQALNMPVTELMQPLNGICLKEDDHMIYAATLSSKHGIRYIPVKDANDKLIGLVSRTDIKRAMADIVGIEDVNNDK